MEIKSHKQRPNGSIRMIIDVQPNEAIIAVLKNTFYKLGHPTETVQHADELIDAVPVVWCSVSQQWVE